MYLVARNECITQHGTNESGYKAHKQPRKDCKGRQFRTRNEAGAYACKQVVSIDDLKDWDWAFEEARSERDRFLIVTRDKKTSFENPRPQFCQALKSAKYVKPPFVIGKSSNAFLPSSMEMSTGHPRFNLSTRQTS